MLQYLKIFLICISVYFILHTSIVFGIFHGNYHEILSSAKDFLWISIVISIYIHNIQHIRKYLSIHIKESITILSMLSIWIIVTYYQHQDLHVFIKNSLIGIKYGFYFMIVFLSAGWIWYIWSQEDNNVHWEKKGIKKINQFIFFIRNLSLFILLSGFVIQWSKVLFPELRYSIGFTTLNIYKAGIAPPIYYLTKHDWIMRLSGLFSWPNNFAFWLIGLTPLLMHTKTLWQKVLVWISGIANLGRVIFVWWMTEAAMVASSKTRIRTHLFLVGLGIWLIIWLFGYITYLKWESTTEHFQLGIDAIHKFMIQPRWYGLGSSGPGVHRNGSLLPENYYLQLALDYWFAWPLLFWLFWFFIIKTIIRNSTKDQVWMTNILFLQGFVGMLVAGIFLHVFEDSMVNYLFFIPWGIVYWYSIWKLPQQ